MHRLRAYLWRDSEEERSGFEKRLASQFDNLSRQSRTILQLLPYRSVRSLVAGESKESR